MMEKITNSFPVIITGVAPTKAEIEITAANIVTAIRDGGDISPLRVATCISAIEQAIKMIRDGIVDLMLAEAEKYGKSFELEGHKYQVKEAGVRYDYNECGDPVWKRINGELERLSIEKKNREDFLKAIHDSQTLVDNETGEVNEIFPPSKTSKTVLSITLAK